MIGKKEFNDRTFSLDSYEEFYEHHHFQPIPESVATSVHEVIPRFGWAFDKVEELKPKSLLDLGCLDGSFANTIARHFGISVVGVDLTRDGVEIAQRRAKDNKLPAEFYQGFVEDWLERFVSEGRKFDCVTFFEIIEHVEDVQRVLKLIDQVLAPGGFVLVSTPDFESPLYGKNDEDNKCHIRLYTTADEDYEAENIYGNVRKATSITKEIGKERIKEIGVYSELINVLYQ
jgi:2-polyprenyl-3-methyl-5-hydroxy-6-metoxy-1,4-benzoquinol methylase